MGLIENLNTLFELAGHIALLADFWASLPSTDRDYGFFAVNVSIAFTTNIAAPPPSRPFPPRGGREIRPGGARAKPG